MQKGIHQLETGVEALKRGAKRSGLSPAATKQIYPVIAGFAGE